MDLLNIYTPRSGKYHEGCGRCFFTPHKLYELLSLILSNNFMIFMFLCRETAGIPVNYPVITRNQKLDIIYNWGNNINTFSLYLVEH